MAPRFSLRKCVDFMLKFDVGSTSNQRCYDVAQDRARSATIKLRALGALKLASEARDKNVPAKRADFLTLFFVTFVSNYFSKLFFLIFLGRTL